MRKVGAECNERVLAEGKAIVYGQTPRNGGVRWRRDRSHGLASSRRKAVRLLRAGGKGRRRARSSPRTPGGNLRLPLLPVAGRLETQATLGDTAPPHPPPGTSARYTGQRPGRWPLCKGFDVRVFKPLPARTTAWWWPGAWVLLGLAGAPASAQPSEGAALYARHCTACHGEKGDGQGLSRAALSKPPRDFTTEDARRTLTREYMIVIVRDGRPGTPMHGRKTRLAQSQIESVVDFIRATYMRSEPGTTPAKAN